MVVGEEVVLVELMGVVEVVRAVEVVNMEGVVVVEEVTAVLEEEVVKGNTLVVDPGDNGEIERVARSTSPSFHGGDGPQVVTSGMVLIVI